MAATAIRIQLKSNRTRPIRNPSFVHVFSSSSSTPGGEPPDNDNNDHTTPPSFSSYLSDVKSSVKQQQQSQPRGSPHPQPFSPSSSASRPSKTASLEEIRKNVTEFRRRAAVPPPSDENTSSFPSPPPSQHISFQELYRTNMIPKGEESNTTEPTTKSSGQFPLYTIRESLKQIRKPQSGYGGVNKWNETTPRHKFTDSLLRPTNSMPVYGPLPASMIGKKEREKKPADDESTKTKFLKIYGREELGEKLRKLRPEEAMKKGGKWFSLGELNERLVKLREIEEKESETRIGGDTFNALRESLQTIEMSNKEKARKATVQLNMLGQLDGTPNLMSSPPKENLVEKYFHPDNMSSAEKMKIELKKVRDEFKMSESDCGSAPVQVAQLTTKIKHLSTVLHKKDKHSRKGVQAMVQQRKKLLKYLRRTDWNSYCLVLSKLRLRDNPDFKN